MVIYAARGLTCRRQGYDLLSLALREQYDIVSLPPIARESQGKPYFPSLPGIHFNLSHSGDLALCALDVFRMGVDIQVVTPHRPLLRERCCSPEERAWLRERGDRWEDFNLLWALKEALVKQRGTGLTSPLSSIAPPLPREGETLLFREGLYFRHYAGAGWRAAACSAVPPPEGLLWKTPFVEKNL